MAIHVYRSHMGGFFLSLDRNDDFLLECPECGKRDIYLGEFRDMDDAVYELRKIGYPMKYINQEVQQFRNVYHI